MTGIPHLEPTSPDLFHGFLLDDDLQVSRHVTVKLYGDRELAQRFDRFVKLDFPPIHVEAFLGERVRDITGSNRTEELVFFAGAAVERDFDAVKLFRQRFGASSLFGEAADGRGLHLLDDGLVRKRGFNGELLRQKKIAAITLGNPYHVAARAELGYIFFQNDFHNDSVSEISYVKSWATDLRGFSRIKQN